MPIFLRIQFLRELGENNEGARLGHPETAVANASKGILNPLGHSSGRGRSTDKNLLHA
jgi:hypothetical protein